MKLKIEEKEEENRACLFCKKVFATSIGSNYCSKGCETTHKKYGKIKKIIIYGNCLECNKKFIKVSKTNTYCSTKCSLKRRETLNLSKPLVREYFFEKANFSCQECGIENNNNLQLHHIFPLYKGGNDEIENIAVLCTNCHKLKHHIQ